MSKVELSYVNEQRGRDGRIAHWYFRRNGRRWRLPPLSEPPSPVFLAEYQRLLLETASKAVETPAGPVCLTAGSFGAVVLDYLASPDFKSKKPNTQSMYRRVLEKLSVVYGSSSIAQLERKHVKFMQAAASETPGMANMVVKIVRILLQYAIENGLRKDNPAQKIKLFKLGEHRAWSDEECAAFERHWPAGTVQRRAYMMARYTGQRCGDLATMIRAHRQDGAIRVVQQKTGAELWILEHRDLAAELNLADVGRPRVTKLRPDDAPFLVRPDGSPFNSRNLSTWFAEAIDATGLPDECVLHGLRKTAARMLAEVGCSVHEIASVTGHASLPEIARYTKAANQRTMATAAILRLEQNGNRTSSGKRHRN